MADVESRASDDPDLLQGMWVGLIKSALRQEFIKNSMDMHCKVFKQPRVMVKVTKNFEKGNFTLVALSNSVSVMPSQKAKETSKAISIGQCFTHTKGEVAMLGMVKSHLTFPSKTLKTDVAVKVNDGFLVAFWACAEHFDANKANCIRKFHDVSVSIGTMTKKIKVPVIVNTKALKAGDEVIIQKVQADSEDEEPVAKKPRKGKGKGRGKASKPKAKGRAKK